jgi:hypothetical protein
MSRDDPAFSKMLTSESAGTYDADPLRHDAGRGSSGLTGLPLVPKTAIALAGALAIGAVDVVLGIDNAFSMLVLMAVALVALVSCAVLVFAGIGAILGR